MISEKKLFEINMMTKQHTPPYQASSLKSHLDFEINEKVQSKNLFWASLTSKLLIKIIANPLQRTQTLLQCAPESYFNRDVQMNLANVWKCLLKSNQNLTRYFWILPRNKSNIYDNNYVRKPWLFAEKSGISFVLSTTIVSKQLFRSHKKHACFCELFGFLRIDVISFFSMANFGLYVF